jgi:FkbM family methyltransferase
VNKAVTGGGDIMMDVDVPDRAQARVSAYGSSNGKQQRISGITLAGLVEEYELQTVDLLKIDCEGGEYAILASTPAEVFDRILNIVFEYHEIDGFQARLEAVKHRLVDNGFCLKTRGSLVSASREKER